MGAPSINITFVEQAMETIQRGQRGVIAMLLKGTEKADYTIVTVDDIPSTLSDKNKLLIRLALMGYVTTPKKIYVYTINDLDYTEALKHLAQFKWDYLVCPYAATDEMTETVATWIKGQRENHKNIYKAILPETAADYEGIINVANSYVYNGERLPVEEACVRAAGIICGTPTTQSCTYAPVTEASDCDRMTKDELDAAVDAGKFVFFWDGEKVKVCRGVNSLVTHTATKGAQFAKIKLVEAMDMIRDDITRTCQDSYIGKYVNTYDSKCLLIGAINLYFDELRNAGVLHAGNCMINTDANRRYYKAHGNVVIMHDPGDDAYREIPLEDATEQELKMGNTGTHVFLKMRLSLLDAIEDIDAEIYI